MVKSKKMSKTSIAVIVLALLLVLSMVMGITGAWFTDSGNKALDGSGSRITFGYIGNVEIAGTDVVWTKGVAAEERGYAMPGDTFTAGGLVLSYTPVAAQGHDGNDEGTAADENGVYYLIYTIDGESAKHFFRITDGAEQLTAADTDKVCGALDASNTSDNLVANIKITKVGGSAEAYATGSSTEGFGNAYMGAEVSVTLDDTTYYFVAIQKANLKNVDNTAGNHTAYDELVALANAGSAEVIAA